MHVHSWRDRVHGPGFPLCSLLCLDDGASFTVYPPGWTPYERKALVGLDHRGCTLAPEAGESPWEGTVFDGVVDASSGKIWPDEVTLGPPVPEDDGDKPSQCKRTQRRHVAGAMRLFALDQAGLRREREQVCQVLMLDLAPLEGAAGRIRDGPRLKVRGEEGAKVLEQLPQVASTIFGLLALGRSRGFWGPALS